MKNILTHSLGSDNLSSYDLENIPDNIIEIWYSYECYTYDGGGVAILKDINGLFYCTKLDHCSCYGPLDNLTLSDGKELDKLLLGFTKEAESEYLPLIAEINKYSKL